VPRENIVWETAPPAGDYAVYVNLNDACGETSATFDLSAWRSAPGENAGEFQQRMTFETAGTLVGLQANGGTQSGLVVTLLGVD
jgi:hypothetical protein